MSIVAIDTEWARGKPWCLSFSARPGEAYVIMADQQDEIALLNEWVSQDDVITLCHNYLYDSPVLAQMGVFPKRPACTMVMAYLLQTEPQGLKPLARRYCGMQMNTYTEMTEPATFRLTFEYLEKVEGRKWPDPAPVMEWVKGVPKVRQPQNIGAKVKRILKAYREKGERDLFDKWKAVKEGKEIVEAEFGPLHEGELCDIEYDAAINYAATDADATIRIWPHLWKKIRVMGLEDTFWRDMRMMPMVVDMMAGGMPVDVEAFHHLSDYLQLQMNLLQRKMQYSVGKLLDGKQVNPASYPQMAELIYDKLKLQDMGGRFKAKKGGGKRSTADDILKRYVGLHDVVQDIIDWRGYNKLKGTYADAIPRLLSEDGRIRTTFRITRTATGRLSSASPNLMNQPTRSEEGRMVRDCYCTGEEDVFISGDYGGVEMRTLAHCANEERMMQIFKDGGDIHSQTASWMFGVPLNMVDSKKHRYPAKKIGFGIVYMITAEGLQREMETEGVKWTLQQCKDAMEAWFDTFPGVRAFMKECGHFAKRYGYVKDMYGRVRYVPGIKSTNKWLRMEAERQAGNAPIQSGSQGIIKEAMGRLVPYYRSIGMEVLKPLIQIHDDIVWEAKQWAVPIVIPEIKRIMEGAAPDGFKVPMVVDFKVGRKWGSMRSYDIGEGAQ